MRCVEENTGAWAFYIINSFLVSIFLEKCIRCYFTGDLSTRTWSDIPLHMGE